MIDIVVEKDINSPFNIEPMSIKRDWMDETSEGHAYRCFPVTQANVVGWSISCDQDIEFIWDGRDGQTNESIEILKAPPITYTGRGQASISLTTGLIFKTEKDMSLLTINPVNSFSKDFETMSSVISTSFYGNPLPLAIKVKRADENVVIKAGTPLATIIPISLSGLNNSSITIVQYKDEDGSRMAKSKSYGEAAQEMNMANKWTDWYRDAVNEKGESLGSHEVKVLKLNVIDNMKDH